MGVKDLWDILSPLCETKPLYELQGKTIAIDLSGWVVDSQTIVDNVVQPKMYLRNLYFRTAILLSQGISPVFVLEGKAPDLKHKTIAKRNNIRYGFREKKTIKKRGRSQFNRVLNECREMLKYMGIDCIHGNGEAEAMCAYLNEDGLVNGCISQDSDCFLYGARVVYRNFCTSTQKNRGATGGSVDVYCMDKIEKILNIGRNKMIALALLCGCDYDEGVIGVGKEAALKFFKTVEDDTVLQRIQKWRTDTKLDKVESNLLNSDLCTSCGHKGKLQKHTKSGCVDCGTIRKCNDDYKEKRTVMLNEISLRKKALRDEYFPKQELIEEFLIRSDIVPTKLNVEWKQPQVRQFIDFMEKHLSWDPQYAFEKIFTLTTRWQLLHLPNLTLDRRLSIPNLFIPGEIKKIRNIRSIASYEISWNKEHDIIEMLKNYKEQTQGNDSDNNGDDVDDSLLTSIEPQDLVLKCYPQLVEAFESIRNAKVKKRTMNSRKKKTNVAENNTQKKDNANLCQKKTRKKAIEIKNNKKMDEFISANLVSLEESFEEMAITPKRLKKKNTELSELKIKDTSENTIMNTKHIKRGPQFDRVLQIETIHSRLNNTMDRMFNELSPDDFMSENEDNDLTITDDVIENICSKQQFEFNIRSYVESTNQPMEKNIKVDRSEASTSNMEKHVHVEDEKEKSDDSDDEFGDIQELYVPINQRIHVGTSEQLLQMCNQIEKKSSVNFDDCYTYYE